MILAFGELPAPCHFELELKTVDRRTRHLVADDKAWAKEAKSPGLGFLGGR